jgi:hypothetical protein
VPGRKREELRRALAQVLRKRRAAAGQPVHVGYGQHQHKGVGVGAVRGRNSTACPGGADGEQVARLVLESAHRLGQPPGARDGALAHVIQRLHRSALRANHQLAGGEILLLAMRQEIIHLGIQHLGKRGVLPEVLAEVGQQVVRWL